MDDFECPELIDDPKRGRRFETTRRVRLSDVTPDGRYRLDAIARAMQDVSADDTDDAPNFGGSWVVRRTVIRTNGNGTGDGSDTASGTYLERLTAATYGSAIGRSWAERRIDITGEKRCDISGSTLWVHIDVEKRRPARLPQLFHDTYGEAVGGRTVSARLRHPDAPPESIWRAWPTRAADLDLQNHVNNAAYWVPVEEALAGLGGRRHPAWAEMEHRNEIGPTDAVETTTHQTGQSLMVWLRVDDEIRASALVRLAVPPAEPAEPAKPAKPTEPAELPASPEQRR